LYWEVHDDSLLNPLVYLPLAILQVDRLGTAQHSLVDSLYGATYSLTNLIFGEELTLLPRTLNDYFLLFKHTHYCLFAFLGRT
jgi:hypothetical protein